MITAVIDGMGGGMGAQIIAQLRKDLGTGAEIVALGANAVATDRMVRAGASRGATGENAFRVTLRTVDCILAPIGVIIPDSMMGEITTAMAVHVTESPAAKYLIPFAQPHFTIVGMDAKPVARLIAEGSAAVRDYLAK